MVRFIVIVVLKRRNGNRFRNNVLLPIEIRVRRYQFKNSRYNISEMFVFRFRRVSALTSTWTHVVYIRRGDNVNLGSWRAFVTSGHADFGLITIIAERFFADGKEIDRRKRRRRTIFLLARVTNKFWARAASGRAATLIDDRDVFSVVNHLPKGFIPVTIVPPPCQCVYTSF